ncbi:type II secretion system protein GspM [Pseudomonas sp. NPDC089996]|uniref:type II secretion system protein GspM n=1 Tax=Pseudomonas sp. NPDC089996 TaxID=3364474 RepID=UPI00382EF02C
MMRWFKQAWAHQWRLIPGARRGVIMVVLWSLALVVLWQLAWAPGKQRLQQAERAHAQELGLVGYLKSVSTGPSNAQQAVSVLTPAVLNARALAAGLRISGLQTRARQVDVSLEGEPAKLLDWLHALERDGAQLRSLQLQVAGEQLQAQLGLELDEDRAD